MDKRKIEVKLSAHALTIRGEKEEKKIGEGTGVSPLRAALRLLPAILPSA